MINLLLALDLAGTFVFAISGAMLGVQRRLDFFGVLCLAFAASTAGGIGRDLLIGVTPPAAIADWPYLAMAAGASIVTYLAYAPMTRWRGTITALDAGGLALFAVSGAQKALDHGIHPVMAALLGMLTGIGGGIVRDLLVARTPPVLERGLYAVPALVGAAGVVIGQTLHWPGPSNAAAGALICFTIRMLAVHRGWNLPVARP